jgi:hypothetical protein
MSQQGPKYDEWQKESQRLGLTSQSAMTPEQVRLFILRWVQAKVIQTRAKGAGQSKTLVAYLKAKFSATRGFIQLMGLVPGLADGCQLLIQARIGAFASAQWMARARLIPAEYKSRCPFCTTAGQEDDVEPETLAHMLLRCLRWATEREDMIAPLLEDLGADFTDDDKVLLLLGGGINKEPRRLAQWQGNMKDATLEDLDKLSSKAWLDADFLAAGGGSGEGAPRICERTGAGEDRGWEGRG